MTATAAALYRRTSASTRSKSARRRACRSSRIGVVSAKTSAASVSSRMRATIRRRFSAYRSSSTWWLPVRLGPLQVVQAAVEVDDVGLLADDPLVEVREHVGAVAAVGRRADDDGLARQPLDDRGA